MLFSLYCSITVIMQISCVCVFNYEALLPFLKQHAAVHVAGQQGAPLSGTELHSVSSLHFYFFFCFALRKRIAAFLGKKQGLRSHYKVVVLRNDVIVSRFYVIIFMLKGDSFMFLRDNLYVLLIT